MSWTGGIFWEPEKNMHSGAGMKPGDRKWLAFWVDSANQWATDRIVEKSNQKMLCRTGVLNAKEFHECE